MVITREDFTYEYLSSLKFNELRKLSSEFRVSKRWAKKQELIENLLAIKIEESFKFDKNAQNKILNEKDWKDGNNVFQALNPANDDKVTDKRLTFTVNKACKFDSLKGQPLINSMQDITSQLTDVDSVEKVNEDDELLNERRATFNVPQNKSFIADKKYKPRTTGGDVLSTSVKLFTDIENRVTISNKEGKSKKLNVEKSLTGETTRVSSPALKMPISVKFSNNKNKKTENQPKVKMLTIPHSKVLKRNKRIADSINMNSPLLKMSQKSINIKKSRAVTKIDVVKSPISVSNSVPRQLYSQSLIKSNGKNMKLSKIPTAVAFSDKTLKRFDSKDENKENGHNGNVNKTGSKPMKPAKVIFQKLAMSSSNFMSPSVQIKKTPIRKCHEELPVKPLTAKTMPDFKKIHQKQFEQMDSLHEYLKKKEERARKLFGTPQPGSQQKLLNSSKSFKSQPSANAKLESRFMASKEKLKSNKIAQTEAVKNKLPPSKLDINVKNKNRTHIHGVRTNKRFELQMKLRNM